MAGIMQPDGHHETHRTHEKKGWLGYSSPWHGIWDYLSYLWLEPVRSEPRIRQRAQMYACAARPSVQVAVSLSPQTLSFLHGSPMLRGGWDP
jgi:hypothetical protein